MQRLSPLRYTNVLASSVDMRKVGVSVQHWDWGWLALTGRPVHVHIAGLGIRRACPESHNARLAGECEHGHRLDDRARQR